MSENKVVAQVISSVVALSVSHTLLHSHLININLCHKLKETDRASHEIPETA